MAICQQKWPRRHGANLLHSVMWFATIKINNLRLDVRAPGCHCGFRALPLGLVVVIVTACRRYAWIRRCDADSPSGTPSELWCRSESADDWQLRGRWGDFGGMDPVLGAS